jgi:hypothetical protein
LIVFVHISEPFTYVVVSLFSGVSIQLLESLADSLVSQSAKCHGTNDNDWETKSKLAVRKPKVTRWDMPPKEQLVLGARHTPGPGILTPHVLVFFYAH